MKLTKSKLKQFIKKELALILKEGVVIPGPWEGSESSEGEDLPGEFDTGDLGQAYEDAQRLLYTHAEEIAADPYGFVDVLETAAQIIKDEQRGPIK